MSNKLKWAQVDQEIAEIRADAKKANELAAWHRARADSYLQRAEAAEASLATARATAAQDCAKVAADHIEDWTCANCDHDSGRSLSVEVEALLVALAPLSSGLVPMRVEDRDAAKRHVEAAAGNGVDRCADCNGLAGNHASDCDLAAALAILDRSAR